MYEFCDEAAIALTPKSANRSDAQTKMLATSCECKHLSLSPFGNIERVQFKTAHLIDQDTVDDLRTDFSRISDKLSQGSQVIVDFEGVESISNQFIEELLLFNRKLRNKGSRIALCELDPTVRQLFFESNVGQGRNV